MPATIVYLRLDSSYDPVFDPNVALQDLAAINQAIQTRLLFFQGEWFENLNDGTPMFQQILGIRRTVNNQELAALALTQRILGTPYVSAVINVSSQINDANRQMSYSATAQTSFGKGTVVIAPASSAKLGG